MSKYKDLHLKTPQEAAKIVGTVEKSNYLAHTIREIELAMLRDQGVHYHIVTYSTATKNKTAKTYFSDQCSTIRLPDECENMSDTTIRLLLAHELGHVVYNFDKLKNPVFINNRRDPLPEEEEHAYLFAYYLVWGKSESHNKDININRFIYNEENLRNSLSNVIKEYDPTLHDSIMGRLSSGK